MEFCPLERLHQAASVLLDDSESIRKRSCTSPKLVTDIFAIMDPVPSCMMGGEGLQNLPTDVHNVANVAGEKVEGKDVCNLDNEPTSLILDLISKNREISMELKMSRTSSFQDSLNQEPTPSQTSRASSQDPDVHAQDSPVAMSDKAASKSAGQAPKPPGQRRRAMVPWTDKEHERFMEGLKRFRTQADSVGRTGKESVGLGPGVAELIAAFVGTRTPSQVRSHAQKYFNRLRAGA